MADATLYVDPICPWSWITAQWLFEAEQVRDLRVDLQVMSLSVLNERRSDLPMPYRRMLEEGVGPARLAVAVLKGYGQSDFRAFYRAFCLNHHNRNRAMNRDLYATALAEADLDTRLVDRAGDRALDRAVRASHHLAVESVADDAGTPVLRLDDGRGGVASFFGPIVSPAPRGEAAGVMWDAVQWLAKSDAFFELKRGRTRGPIFE